MLTNFDAFNPGQPWPPEPERSRLLRYRQNKLLWRPDINSLEGLERLGRRLSPTEPAERFIFNFHKRLTTLWADLLFGEPPIWVTGAAGSPEAERLADLVARTAINTVGYDAALDWSRYGTGVFRVGLEQGWAVIDVQPPQHWYPVVSAANIRHVQAHVLASVLEVKTRITRRALLLQIHTRGAIEYRAHWLQMGNDSEGRIGERLPLELVAPEIASRDAVAASGIEQTGLDDFLVIPVHNLRTSDETVGRDDYTDLDTIIAAYEARLDDINEILREHAAPFMAGPVTSLERRADGSWGFNSRQKYIGLLNENDPMPQYITWDGKLTDALEHLNRLEGLLYLVSETTPAAFGQQREGLAESGSALKRLLMPVLQKVSRAQTNFDPAMKRALAAAARLEGAELSGIGSQWRDGLPNDETETAQQVQAYRAVGAMSLYDAVQTRHPDWSGEQIEHELDRIAEDEARMAGSSGSLPPAAIDPGGR